MEWYSKRGDASENRIKDLKIGFGMDSMPCGTFEANAVFFSIGVLAYNQYLGLRSDALGSGWERSQIQTVRWRLFQTAGKIVRHGRQVFLKISAAMLDVFAAIRERCARVMREGALFQKRRDGQGLFVFAIHHTEHGRSTAKPRAKRLDGAKTGGQTAATNLGKAPAP